MLVGGFISVSDGQFAREGNHLGLVTIKIILIVNFLKIND